MCARDATSDWVFDVGRRLASFALARVTPAGPTAALNPRRRDRRAPSIRRAGILELVATRPRGYKDRTRGLVDQAVGDRADHHPREGAVATRADHDQVNFVAAILDDCRCDRATNQVST